MRIVIQSMSRAATMTTHKLFENYTVCVPESQAEDYAAVVGEKRVAAHPDTVIGISAKRNWMLRELMDDEALVCFDDDIEYVTANETAEGNPNVTDAEVLEGIIEQVFILAHDMDAKLFGWDMIADRVMIHLPQKPFQLTGYVANTACGYLASHDFHFPEDLWVKMDYWVSLMNAYKHRYCLKDMRYSFVNVDTFKNKGGLSHFRNSVTERDAQDRLIRAFGEAVKVNAKGGYHRKTDYEGHTKLTIQVPF